MKIKNLVTIIAIMALLYPLSAQEVHYLNLAQARQIAAERSYSMRNLREDFRIAEFQLRAAINRFKTQVDLYLTAPDYTETITSLTDSTGTYYFPLKQGTYSGNLQISQPLPTDGQLFISSGIYHIQDYFKNERSFRLNTRVGFEQPIEAIYSYNRIKSSLRQAELRYELSERRLTRARLDLDYEATSAYYALLSALETEKIAYQTLQLQQETFDLAINKYKAGVIAEVEALQMEVDLGEAQNNYDVAVANRMAEANYLKQLLDISLSDSIAIEADLSYEEVKVDLDKALQYGLKNRLEIREREIQQEQAEITIRSTRVQHQITGSISGYYDLIGYNETDETVALATNFNDAWRDLERRPGNRGVALELNIPIWDWGVNKAQVQAAEASLRQAKYSVDNEKVDVERDIRNTVNRLQSSLKRLKLLEKTVDVAERSFEISKNRFANGDINSQSLALDRQRLSNAYNTRLSALISYKLLLADLTRKTFFDFLEQDEVTGE